MVAHPELKLRLATIQLYGQSQIGIGQEADTGILIHKNIIRRDIEKRTTHPFEYPLL